MLHNVIYISKIGLNVKLYLFTIYNTANFINRLRKISRISRNNRRKQSRISSNDRQKKNREVPQSVETLLIWSQNLYLFFMGVKKVITNDFLPTKIETGLTAFDLSSAAISMSEFVKLLYAAYIYIYKALYIYSRKGNKNYLYSLHISIFICKVTSFGLNAAN